MYTLCFPEQGGFRLGQPEGHRHSTVHCDGGRELAAGFLLLAERAVQHPQAEVAVRLERAHAQRLGQGQGLSVGSFGQLGLRGLAVRVNLAKEPQSPRLLTLLCMRACRTRRRSWSRLPYATSWVR